MVKKISNYRDLEKGRDRFTYRLFEILPGFLSWATLINVVLLSWQWPFGIAIFIIVFDLYWLAKISYLSGHLIVSYCRMKKYLRVNWSKKCSLDFYHLIILPFYKEDLKILRSTFSALISSTYPLKKFIVVLGSEARAPEGFRRAKIIEKEFGHKFFKFLITRHPANIPGELAGKGSNESWAGKKAKKLIDKLKIKYDKIICSVFDVDTCIHPQYFARLTYLFQRQKNPHQCSYQPIALYHNNLWDAPALMRVIATSNSFWQMMQQERPEKLCTFSSHSMSFKTVVEINFWQENIVSEDSRIFFQCLFHFKGKYKVVPMFVPVYMDTVLGPTYLQSIKAQYKQQRRWGWGCENIPWILYHSLKTKKMSFFLKLRHCFDQIEGFHSWATASLIIFALGWLPVLLGGENFNQTVLAFNLPKLTSWIMSLAMIGMFVSATISILLLPKRPKKQRKSKLIFMLLQWLLLPITVTVFGSIPALEAQTRLMLGKYMGFFVTPKIRK